VGVCESGTANTAVLCWRTGLLHTCCCIYALSVIVHASGMSDQLASLLYPPLTGHAARQCSHCTETWQARLAQCVAQPEEISTHAQLLQRLRCHHLVPPVPAEPCSCGSSWDPRDPVAMGWITQPQAVLLGRSAAEEVEVYHRRCSNPGCACRLPYTGENDGIFNHSNKFLIRYDVVLMYWGHFAVARNTLSEEYTVQKLAYNLGSCSHLGPSRNTHRCACNALLDSCVIKCAAGCHVTLPVLHGASALPANQPPWFPCAGRHAPV
jgi:hypothetical protein